MFQSILLPVDLNHLDAWKKVIPVAVAMARLSGGPLHVLSVVPDFGSSMVAAYFPADFEKNALQRAQTDLVDFVSNNVPDDINCKTHVGHGRVYNEIIKTADALDVDLIVMGSRHEDYNVLIGSNAERVARHARQSILIIRY